MRSVRGKVAVLAIEGGRPVRESLLPYGHQQIDEEDIESVADVLRSPWITSGPKVREFEEAIATFVGARDAITFSSGTAALHAAAFAAGLGPGDEGITSPLTFCATANCVLYQGAKPVFADVEPRTLTIDPEQVARKITAKTKVILPVDYAGHPAQLQSILELADRHGLTVIEDASHALGADYGGRRVGGISHMTVFSFHPVKHVTTGEGGMVTTNDAELARRLRQFRNHGIDGMTRGEHPQEPWYYEMVALGYNYRLTDIGCALGCSQLKRLEKNIARRRTIASRYTHAFQDLPGAIPPTVEPDAGPAWHFYPLRLDLPQLRVGRADIFRGLRAEGIGVNVHYIPVHWHPYYRHVFGDQRGQFPMAEAAYEALISLPLFHGMTDQDVRDVIEAVHKVASHYSRHSQSTGRVHARVR